MQVRYDRAAIMARAWEYFRACQAAGSERTLGDCLRDAWVAARFDAYAWRYGCATDIHLIYLVENKDQSYDRF